MQLFNSSCSCNVLPTELECRIVFVRKVDKRWLTSPRITFILRDTKMIYIVPICQYALIAY